MGSSIESAVVFTIVLLLLTYLITEPLAIVAECSNSEKMFMDNLEEHLDNSAIYKETDGGISTSPEKLCTALSGLSDSYQIIYSGVVDYLSAAEEGDDVDEEE